MDTKEERKYRQLRELGQKLHIPIPEVFIKLEVFSKDGRLIQTHKQRGHSWTRNAYNMMFSQLAGKDGDDVTFEGGKVSGKKTDGNIGSFSVPISVTYEESADGTTGGYRAAANLDIKGIVVGSGVNAEDFEDYVLQTLITSGAAAGQLNYAQSEEHAISYAALALKNDLIRYFNNNSGGNVLVNEVALIFNGWLGPAQFLVTRDKLASTVTVPDTGQLKVTYTIQLTYPS